MTFDFWGMKFLQNVLYERIETTVRRLQAPKTQTLLMDSLTLFHLQFLLQQFTIVAHFEAAGVGVGSMTSYCGSIYLFTLLKKFEQPNSFVWRLF